MEYTTEIKINAPIEKVAGLLSDHEEMKKWIPEIESYIALSGEPRKVNARTRLNINAGPRTMAVTEIILAINYPENFKIRYEMKEGELVADSRLKALSKSSTFFSLHQKFAFKGGLKLATVFMKPAFMKHSRKMLEDFKKLAEH